MPRPANRYQSQEEGQYHHIGQLLCDNKHNRAPNFVLLDWVDDGRVIEAGERLNGF